MSTYIFSRNCRSYIQKLCIPSTTSRTLTPLRTFSVSSFKKSDLKALWGILPKTGEKMPNSEPPKHEMAYFKGLATSTRAFGEFRRVLFTGLYSQLVVMEIPVGGEIGMWEHVNAYLLLTRLCVGDEVHTVDQTLIFTSGQGLATVGGKEQEVNAGMAYPSLSNL